MELLLVKIRKFRKKPNCSLEQKPPRRSGELTAEGGSAQLSRSLSRLVLNGNVWLRN